MSLSLRERGLKSITINRTTSKWQVALLARAWIEILFAPIGVFITIGSLSLRERGLKSLQSMVLLSVFASLSLRERGLKLYVLIRLLVPTVVALLARAWIEIVSRILAYL